MSKYNLFSTNPDNQTLADSLYKSKKKTKKRKIRILPFFIKKNASEYSNSHSQNMQYMIQKTGQLRNF